MTGLDKFKYFLRQYVQSKTLRNELGYNAWFKKVHKSIGGTANSVANIKRILKLGSEICNTLLSIINGFNDALDEDSNKHFESCIAFVDFLMISW